MRQGTTQCAKTHFFFVFKFCIFGVKKYNRVWDFGKK